MSASNGNDREEGDLLDIVMAGDFKRLTAADYPKLLPLRDHYDRKLELVNAAIAACPTQPTAG